MNRNHPRPWQPPKTLLLAALVAAFSYGILVGQYQIFPYELIRSVKNMVDGETYATRAAALPSNGMVRYRNRRDILDIYETTSDVVMVGDSITDYLDWSELFSNASIANRGISGDTTERVLTRMHSIYSTGAKKAFVMIGINDLLYDHSVDDTYANYELIIDSLLSNKIQPVIQSTILAGARHKAVNGKVVDLNRRLRKLAETRDILYIDLNKSLTEDGILLPDYTMDDIHLNAAGYRVWKGSIEQILLPGSDKVKVAEPHLVAP